MRERPILFSGPMVCAILDGRKTQTRRAIRNPDRFSNIRECGRCCPYGVKGEALWVRETFANMSYDCDPHGPNWTYRADTPSTKEEGWALPSGVRWKPGIHMPRAASRIQLRVTDARVEKLQEMSAADAFADGGYLPPFHGSLDCDTPDPRDAFRELWDRINGKRAPWSSNPWVWVVQFARL